MSLDSDLLLRLAVATVLGAAIGINREFNRQPAGVRTHAMVSLGAALLTVVAASLGGPTVPVDTSAVSRVLQGIVVGIGFVGGGAIVRRDDAPSMSATHGLATATSIWVVAAVGVAAGLGMWQPAIASVMLALLVLSVGARIDRAIDHAVDRRRPSARDARAGEPAQPPGAPR